MAEDGEEALLNCLSFVKFRFKSGGEEAQLTAVLESIVKRLSAKGHYANLLQALQSATVVGVNHTKIRLPADICFVKCTFTYHDPQC